MGKKKQSEIPRINLDNLQPIAQDMSEDKLITYGNDIRNNQNQEVVDALAKGEHQQITDWYNQVSVPDYNVWRTLLALEVVGVTLDGQNLADMTASDAERLGIFFQVNPGGVIPSRQDHRAFFEDVFSGANGAESLAALNQLWRKLASYVEMLFVRNVEGSDGSFDNPDEMDWEGPVTVDETRVALERTEP